MGASGSLRLTSSLEELLPYHTIVNGAGHLVHSSSTYYELRYVSTTVSTPQKNSPGTPHARAFQIVLHA
eukprot:5117808-Pleurochrysis_carterae.AAC.2